MNCPIDNYIEIKEKRKPQIVRRRIYYDRATDKWFVLVNNKIVYVHEDKYLFENSLYIYSSPTNKYYALPKPFSNKLYYQAQLYTNRAWTLFVDEMVVYGRIINNEFIPTLKSLNDYAKKYIEEYNQLKGIFKKKK